MSKHHFTPAELDKGYRIIEEDSSVIKVTFSRDSSTDEDSHAVAKAVKNEFDTICHNYGPDEALILVELFDSSAGIVGKKAKATYKEVLNNERVHRMALYGGSARFRAIAKMILPLTRKHKLKVFTDKHSALQWLIRM